MNTDIRIAVGFWAHPKTKRLIRETGLEGVRSLQILWAWAAQNRPDGNLTGFDPDDIEDAADWDGERGFLYKALIPRWLEKKENGELFLHDWEEHNPWVADTTSRSGKAYMSKLAQVNRPAYDHLVEQKRTSLTQEQYHYWKKIDSDNLANASDSQSDRKQNAERNDSETPAPAPAPAPAPTPTPAPTPDVVKKEKPLSSVPDDCDGNPSPDEESKSEEEPDKPNDKKEKCPHQKIIDIYHEVLPELNAVQEWPPHRQAFLRTRWKEKKERQHLEWWKKYFQFVKECPFLMGKTKEEFYATLEWLIRPRNMPKVLEGNYLPKKRGSLLSDRGMRSARAMATWLQGGV